MKTVNGKPVTNAQYKRNQAAYHNVGYDFAKMQDKARAEQRLEEKAHPLVLGTSKAWVETFTEPSVIIAFGDPHEAHPDYACKHKDILRIEIDDIDQDMGPEYILFDYAHSSRILGFLRKHVGEPIIVHCHAGISRSAGLVKFMIDKMGYKLSTREECTVKGFPSYNAWVYRQMEIAHMDSIFS